MKLIKTSPINSAVASGKGNRFFYFKTACSNHKWQIAIDRHSPRLIPNHCHLSDPPHFRYYLPLKGHGNKTDFRFFVSFDLNAGFFGYVAFSAVDFGGNILTAFPASRSIGKHWKTRSPLGKPFAPWKPRTLENKFAPWKLFRTLEIISHLGKLVRNGKLIFDCRIIK